jgi:hypothetical protein
MKAIHRSRGGGRMNEGTLIISTRISQRIRSARKNTIRSMMFLVVAFTSPTPKPTLKESSYPVKEMAELSS